MEGTLELPALTKHHAQDDVIEQSLLEENIFIPCVLLGGTDIRGGTVSSVHFSVGEVCVCLKKEQAEALSIREIF